jgi:phosphatidylethanolamine/phosphatidyl-N-methylethanolamine N-methyltransferase
LVEQAHFIRALIDNPATTGAVSPSGRFLARRMARHVDPKEAGLVVELGPGTGPVTQALIDEGIAEERLVLVEFDSDFCQLLERRFPRAKVICGDAVNLSQTLAGKLDAPVAAIVSSLPLLNMPDAQRLALLEDAFRLMQGKGRFVQFTYGLVSPMPKKPKDARPVPFYAEASAPVWLNLPPARVWVYRPATEAPRAKLHPAEALMDKIAGEIRLRKAQARAARAIGR